MAVRALQQGEVGPVRANGFDRIRSVLTAADDRKSVVLLQQTRQEIPSNGLVIEQGTAVKVVEVRGTRLVVEATESPQTLDLE